MTEDDVIRLSYEHFAGLFPRNCTNCGRGFENLREYVLATARIGATISYDAELGDWKTQQPLGAAALANCTCGSTLALTTEGMPLETIHALLEWIRIETERRGVTAADLVSEVREGVRRRAVGETAWRRVQDSPKP